MDAINVCPICKGDAEVKVSKLSTHRFYVECGNGCLRTGCHDTQGGAIEAWNTSIGIMRGMADRVMELRRNDA